MTYHTSKQSRYAAIPAVVALAFVTFAGVSAVTDAALAKPYIIGPTGFTMIVENNDIKISKSKLKKACSNSGGTWFSGKSGYYGCGVNRSDGGYTDVSCKSNGTCKGKTTSPQ